MKNQVLEHLLCPSNPSMLLLVNLPSVGTCDQGELWKYFVQHPFCLQIMRVMIIPRPCMSSHSTIDKHAGSFDGFLCTKAWNMYDMLCVYMFMQGINDSHKYIRSSGHRSECVLCCGHNNDIACWHSLGLVHTHSCDSSGILLLCILFSKCEKF